MKNGKKKKKKKEKTYFVCFISIFLPPIFEIKDWFSHEPLSIHIRIYIIVGNHILRWKGVMVEIWLITCPIIFWQLPFGISENKLYTQKLNFTNERRLVLQQLKFINHYIIIKPSHLTKIKKRVHQLLPSLSSNLIVIFFLFVNFSNHDSYSLYI